MERHDVRIPTHRFSSVAGILCLLLSACGGGGGGGGSGPASSIDLRVTSFTASNSGTAGSSISVSDTVTNGGSTAAGPFDIGIYLSTNDVISTSDTRLMSFRSVNGLSSGGSSTGSGTATLPGNLTPGTYYLGAIADDLNEVRESNESNNVSNVVTITVAAAAAPDLVASSLTAPSSGTAGTSISIGDTVTNSGMAAAGAFDVGIYLSTNNVISTSDTLLGSRTVTSLAVGAGSNGLGTITLPGNLASGTYYLGAIADDSDAVIESNEANNVSNVVTILIAASTSAACSLDGFEQDDSAAAARVISVGQTQNHNFCDDAADWLQFTAVSGTSYTLETAVTGAADTVLELYASDGVTLLTSNDDINTAAGLLASRITWTAPSSGTYYAKVRSYAGAIGAGNDYSVNLRSP